MMESLGVMLLALVIVVVSTILHELMHGAVAYMLGDTTAQEAGRLTLNPLKHIDPYMSILVPVILCLLGGPIIGGAKPVPVNSRNLKGKEWGMALVALAGPLTNIVLAFVAFVVAVITGTFYIVDGAAYMTLSDGATVAYYVMMINLTLAIFNLIPVPPLDGSRLVYAIAPDGAREVMGWMERYGVMLVLVLVLLFSSQIYTFIMAATNWMVGIFTGIVGIF